MYKKILIPTDGSEYAKNEADRAMKLVDDDGEILILSVATEIRKTAFHRSKYVDMSNREAKKEARQSVKELKEYIGDEFNVRTKVVVDFPAEAINKIAKEENVDLIVIAPSGKSGIHRFVIGSVAEKVLKDSEIDVLLVRE